MSPKNKPYANKSSLRSPNIQVGGEFSTQSAQHPPRETYSGNIGLSAKKGRFGVKASYGGARTKLRPEEGVKQSFTGTKKGVDLTFPIPWTKGASGSVGGSRSNFKSVTDVDVPGYKGRASQKAKPEYDYRAGVSTRLGGGRLSVGMGASPAIPSAGKKRSLRGRVGYTRKFNKGGKVKK